MPISCDVLIIGSGQAGNPLATAFADAGRRVVLVEENLLGGSCINYGCTPTKTMLASAERAHHIRTAADFGVQAGEAQVNMAAIVARKDAVIQEMRDGIRKNLEQQHKGITVLNGHAAFTEPHVVRVALAGGKEQTVTAPLVFINTGTRPNIPEIDGLSKDIYLTTNDILNIKEVPEHLIILGGGYIGLEFSQMFRRFGSRVTVVESGAELLEHEDDDVCRSMQELIEAEGVEFVLNARAHRVSCNDEGAITVSVHTRAGERRLRGTHLLVATGRRPNTDAIDLEKVGIKTDEQGYIQVNSRLETSVRGVYALGDVHGGPQFTHISYDDFRVIRDNLLLGKRRSAKQRPLPYVVFTEPQLGRIGLSESQAQEKKIPYRVATMPVQYIGRARQTAQTAGFFKVLVDNKDQIIGAAILCEQGGEIMSMLQLAMAGKLPYTTLQDTVFAHPTWAEALNNMFAKLEKPK
ncbi:mercuric reductase [Hymenobacter jejuensis]|uniref:Mercuric reductase n=1 Tax=Hymenobacter jejuensis TaxID=2502781 RepID=A0A5B7ZX86_9BACT|nr:mercuric reductase [Hymenobacter jejuensis]QDA59487.1 mercuric reductase [Hymenobacter jejuensis]